LSGAILSATVPGYDCFVKDHRDWYDAGTVVAVVTEIVVAVATVVVTAGTAAPAVIGAAVAKTALRQGVKAGVKAVEHGLEKTATNKVESTLVKEVTSEVSSAADTGVVSQGDQFVFRVHGGDSAQWGHSWTPENPMRMQSPRSSLGLPNGNSGQLLTRARVVSSEGVVERAALPLDGNPGGATEWLFPNPETQLVEHWTIPLVPPW
jgi:hypothetical protein